MKKLFSYSGVLFLFLFISCSGPESTDIEDESEESTLEVNAEESEEADDEENEREITSEELPQTVRDAIVKSYPGAEIQEAEEITGEDGSLTYEIEIKTTEGEMELMYSASGEFLGMEQEEKDDASEENGSETK